MPEGGASSHLQIGYFRPPFNERAPTGLMSYKPQVGIHFSGPSPGVSNSIFVVLKEAVWLLARWL